VDRPSDRKSSCPGRGECCDSDACLAGLPLVRSWTTRDSPAWGLEDLPVWESHSHRWECVYLALPRLHGRTVDGWFRRQPSDLVIPNEASQRCDSSNHGRPLIFRP
jgi:hypothetical protein